MNDPDNVTGSRSLPLSIAGDRIADAAGEPVVVRWMSYRFWPATLEQMMNDRLSDYLKTQFTDLDGAKAFMRRWFVEMDQEIPGHGGFSIRAMAGHCAAALMGDPDAYQGFYFSMPHGPELYWAALEARDGEPAAPLCDLASPTSAKPAQAPDAEPCTPQPPSPAP